MTVNRNAAFFESLEDRRLMSAGTAGTYVYLESNKPVAGQNAVLAYKADPATGALTGLSHYKYLTGGTGYRNTGAALGPDDSDKEVIASPDGKFLFAINQGSDSVSVFSIHSDGTLSLLHGGAYASGGTQPVSLSFSNDHLFVLNRGNSQLGKTGTVAPNITSFLVGESGALYAVPSATVTLPLNLSSAQILTTANGKLAFVDNFATPDNLKVSLANTLEAFSIGSDGLLSPTSTGSAGLPKNPPLLLGLVEDPVHHLIYAGLPSPVSGGVATFSYTDAGQVSYLGSVPSKGLATCWLNISPDGKFLYGADSASDALSVYSLSNPTNPKLVQEFQLQGRTHRVGDTTSTGPTSQDFQFSFDPTGKHLWVVNHTIDDQFQQGNQVHILNVASNGTLSETAKTVYFPASIATGLTHVNGIAVVTADGYYKGSGAPTYYAAPASAIATAIPVKTTFASQPITHQPLVDDLMDSMM